MQLTLNWNRAAALTTIEFSTNAAGGFLPIGTGTNGFEYIVATPADAVSAGFYRLKQND
jgi:hypothetical protein